MKKIIILLFGLMLTAASCNILGGGTRGVLKSQDGGNTYSPANQLVDDKGDIDGLQVNVMTVDPNNSDTVYLGSASGVHRTTDGAQTWKHVLTGIQVGGVQVDPSQSSIIYVTGISGNNGRVLKTTDGGETWKDVYTEPTRNNPALSLAISKANAKVLLVGLNNGGVIRSLDEGATWQLVRNFSNPVISIQYVDSSTAYALTRTGGLYVSTNQGSVWTPVDLQIQAEDSTVTSRLSGSRTFYNAAFDPALPSVIFLATSQGLLRTVDSGRTWVIMSIPVTNAALNISAAAINPNDSNNLLIAVGSTMFKSTNGGLSWETKKLPTEQRVKQILFNPTEPNNIYLGLTSN
jgi:photosystem II stability/assembly factor-like uncharacterized protein